MTQLWVSQRGEVSCANHVPGGDTFEWDHWQIFRHPNPGSECESCGPRALAQRDEWKLEHTKDTWDRAANRIYFIERDDPELESESSLPEAEKEKLIGKTLINIRLMTEAEAALFKCYPTKVLEFSDGSLIFESDFGLTVKLNS